ncbi:MAG: AraC family transcriptional regulator [Psychroserpens sp.]|uniref:helix-turn-helix domain-containing protein n=1 Tax=Psychroserpens sp. TaxID=2020870 RepID=UPI00300391C5
MNLFSTNFLEINSAKGIHLIWVYNINLDATFNSNSIILKKNNLVIVRPNEKFSGRCDDFSEFKVIRFKENESIMENSFLYNLLTKYSDRTSIIEVDDKTAKEIDNSFAKAANCSCLQNGLNTNLLINDVNELIINKKEVEKNSRFGLVFDFQKLLMDNYKWNHSVAGYSKELGIKPKKLLKNMQRLGFKNPSVMIKEKLLLEAMKLLVHSSKSSKDICFDLGFDDPAYFTRIFKSNTGITPLNYRTIHRNSDNCEKCPI